MKARRLGYSLVILGVLITLSSMISSLGFMEVGAYPLISALVALIIMMAGGLLLLISPAG